VGPDRRVADVVAREVRVAVGRDVALRGVRPHVDDLAGRRRAARGRVALDRVLDDALGEPGVVAGEQQVLVAERGLVDREVRPHAERRPSAVSTRTTCSAGLIEKALRAASSSGTSGLRANGPRLRLRDASRTPADPMPTTAGARRSFAARIASAMPSAVRLKTRASKRSPPSAA
jgi:hypothetical protein